MLRDVYLDLENQGGGGEPRFYIILFPFPKGRDTNIHKKNKRAMGREEGGGREEFLPFFFFSPLNFNCEHILRWTRWKVLSCECSVADTDI